MKNLFSILLLGLLGLMAPAPGAAQGITANDFGSSQPYTGAYAYGLNPGWYGYNWTTQQVLDLGAGTPGIKGLGAHSFRMQLYDDFLETYGFNYLVPDYEHLKQLGAHSITAFLGSPSAANTWDTSFYTRSDGTRVGTRIFKGIYKPVWLDSAHTVVNPENTFAAYTYKTVKTYGPYVTFWEVVNEPDFTYNTGGWLADAAPSTPGTWFYVDPTAQDLVNLGAPIYYYIRELRVAWEVIKRIAPEDYVCTGGIGNRSFLAALLRDTDNPDGGKVTADYPLTAGAYFDVCSFHTYPEFSTLVKYWDNATGTTAYSRNSDTYIRGHLLIKHWMDSLLRLDGYDGIRRPAKQFICTETGASREMNGDTAGGNLLQLNYQIKAPVLTQKDGQIKQTYWYQTGDAAGADHWSLFGCYRYFGSNQPLQATKADQGVAALTVSQRLYGKIYDRAYTEALALVDSIDGAAFSGSFAEELVLWAKTSGDLCEEASATYRLPAGRWIRREWNASETGASMPVSGSVTLSGTPSFFELSSAQVLPVKLLSFTVHAQGPAALLEWQSGEEQDFSRYQVEHATTPAGFLSIGSVLATGSGSRYRFTDAFPLEGVNYYRLKLIDQDGRASYSEVRTIQLNTIPYSVEILDPLGRRIRQGLVRDPETLKKGLRPGLYFINLSRGAERRGQKTFIY